MEPSLPCIQHSAARDLPRCTCSTECANTQRRSLSFWISKFMHECRRCVFMRIHACVSRCRHLIYIHICNIKTCSKALFTCACRFIILVIKHVAVSYLKMSICSAWGAFLCVFVCMYICMYVCEYITMQLRLHMGTYTLYSLWFHDYEQGRTLLRLWADCNGQRRQTLSCEGPYSCM